MNQRLCILAEAADIPFDFISLWEFDFISLWDPELQQSSVKLRCQTESPQLQQLSRFMLVSNSWKMLTLHMCEHHH